MADRIADDKFDLKPGGKLAEITVLFTDFQGFTAMSEEIEAAQRISDLLLAGDMGRSDGGAAAG